MENKDILMKFISNQGYKKNSPDKHRPINVIPSNRITMKDVEFPVHGVDDLGNEIVMQPGQEYKFPGNYVVETPLNKMQKGGVTEKPVIKERIKGAYLNDFLFTDEDLKFANDNPDEYCPKDGDCLSTALKGYDAMVASKHKDFPSQHSLKDNYEFASANTENYRYDKDDGKIYYTDEDNYKAVSPKTQEWFETQPFFDLKKQNFSVDSWDVHGQLLNQGGINIYSHDEEGFDWDSSHFANLSPSEKKEIYAKIPVGAFIGFAGASGRDQKSINKEMGLAHSGHSAMVVGFAEDGVPIIYDWGEYRRLDDNTLSRGLTNITFPKEFENKTLSGLDFLDKFDETPTKLNLDYSAFDEGEANADMGELGKFYGTLKDRKLDLMNDLNLNNKEYDQMAKLLMSISMQETGGGSAPEHNIQSTFGTKLGDTQGLSQLNIVNVLDDEQLAPIAKKYDITEEEDLHDPKKSAIASMIYAKRNMLAANKNYEKGLFEPGKTGVRTYSPRSGFIDYVRDAASKGKTPHDGYTYHTEEGEEIDLLTGNNALRLGYDKSLKDIQSQLDAVDSVMKNRYRVYEDNNEDGKLVRKIDKVTLGNSSDLTPEQIFTYNWQSPYALKTGDAQGGSNYVKQIMDYYNSIKEFQDGGLVPEKQEDPMLSEIYGNYPAMRNMGPVTLKADDTFTKDFTGKGDIEYFKPEPQGRGSVIYSNGSEYNHPDTTKSTHGIVYNPNTNSAQNVFLDMLHGMTEADPKYRALRKNFKNAMLKAEQYGFEADWNEHVAQAGGEENTDGRTKFIENWTDGKLRNLLFEAHSPEDWEKNNYWDKAKETYLRIPELNKTFSALNKYLITNEVSDKPEFTLPEVEVKPGKKLNPGERFLNEPIDSKYKQGGTTYSMTNDIKETQKLLSLLT